MRRIYGPRTERFDPNQPLLISDAFEPVATAVSEPDNSVPLEPEPEAVPKKKPRPHGRRVVPMNLRRVPRVYELTETERRCPECGGSRIQISVEYSEQLDHEPSTLFVIEHIRCTYDCPHCEGQIVTAGKPAQPIRRGLPGPGLLAHVITEKADAFSGYDGIYAGGDVVEVGRTAHAPRKFIEAQATGPARTAAALAYHCRLYAIETAIKAEIAKLLPEADEPTRAAIRLRGRQERAVPVLEAFGKWLEAQKAYVLPKSPPGGANGYVQNSWDALKRYTGSGYLLIDKNVAGQQIRIIAIGGKNRLFTGSEAGGKTMAVLFSLVSSCQRHGHDPFVYLRDVPERLPDHPQDRLAELLPNCWLPPKSAEAPAPGGEPAT